MLNELKAYKNLDVYVTGSNSKGLSKDIATEFRGRATQIHVFPLCFEEFYSAVGGDERKALDTYMLYGGMPRLLAMQDDKDKKDFRSSLASAASTMTTFNVQPIFIRFSSQGLSGKYEACFVEVNFIST